VCLRGDSNCSNGRTHTQRPAPPPSHTRRHACTTHPPIHPPSRAPQRYREVLHDFKAAYRRQQAAVRARLESAALLSSLRRGPGGGGDTSVTDALLRERGSLAASGKAIDGVLAQASETRDALARQRAGLATAAGRLGSIASGLPGVAQLMGAISRRRNVNDSVVGLVAAAIVCFFLWWFALRKT
jgi:hypothetical protein